MFGKSDKKDNIEMITGNPKKAILKLSIPMMFTLLISILYNVVDSIWVVGLGPEPLVAMGLITPLYMVIISIGNGIGAGANSLISRYIGAEKYTQANNAGIHALLLSIIFSVIPGLTILIFLKPVLILLGAGTSLKYGMDYSSVIFSFLFIIIFATVLTAIYRAEGNIKTVTFALLFSSLLNYILDPIFIYKLNLGIAGSAWASVLSALISIIILSYGVWIKKSTFLNLSFKTFSLSSDIIKEIFLVAIPSSLQLIIMALMFAVVNSLLLEVAGHTAVAVVTASFKIILLANLPLNSLGVAALTVVGIGYGAKNYKNLMTTYYHSIKLGFIFTFVIVIFIFLFSSEIAHIFSYNNQNAILKPYIASTIRFLSLYVLVSAPALMSYAFFQGVGKGIYSLILNFISSLLLESIFAYIFGIIWGWGVEGIYSGLIFGCLLGSILSYIVVMRFMNRFKKDSTE